MFVFVSMIISAIDRERKSVSECMDVCVRERERERERVRYCGRERVYGCVREREIE